MSEPDATRSLHSDRRAGERRLYSRVLWPALLLSAALHIIALFFIGFRTPTAQNVTARVPRLLRIVPVMQAYDIAAPNGAISARELPQSQEKPARASAIRTAVPDAIAPVADAPAASVVAPATRQPGEASVERLRYRAPVAEVWRRSDPPAPSVEQPSAEEMVRARIAAQIGAYNDSMSADAAARERATDWTVKDADGGRWGVSPGAIHLGSITLPLPFTLSTPPGRREEVAGRLASWQAIQQQATIVEGRDIVKERVRAIEQRKAAERAARQKAAGTTSGASAGSGTPAAPRTGGSTNGSTSEGAGASRSDPR